MGSRFHHTHVRTADAAAVADALCERALANKFSLATEGQSCDYDVVVATTPGSPEWTSIYNPFGHFMWELSDTLTTYVVELEIFDSDVLYARLSNEGCQVDVFCSNPDYTDEPARAVKGQPKRWDSVCVPGKNSRDVQRVFKGAVENPELALVELGSSSVSKHGASIPNTSTLQDPACVGFGSEIHLRRDAGSSPALLWRSSTRTASWRFR